MKTYMHILIFLLSALLFYGCDSAEPNKDVHPNFTWKIYNIGTAYDTNIRDILVIDENNIWVVGEIADESTGEVDSTGHVIKPWNVGIWNGEKWDLKTVLYKDVSFGVFQSVWAFDRNDVWFGATSSYTHWNGNDYSFYDIPGIQGPETRIWGSAGNYLYIADKLGTISYYDGTSWETRITNTNKTENFITDSWGVTNSNTLFVGFGSYYYQTNKILRINADALHNLRWDSTKIPYDMWTDNINTLWVASRAVWKYESGNWQELIFSHSREALCIKGNSQNNIYVIGNNNLIAHFNGISWRNYDIGLNEYTDFYTLSVTEKAIAFAGYAESGFLVVVGYIS